MADLAIRHLGKDFGAAPVLQDVSLEVASGRLVAVLGASGSGKTTLLRLIAGFEAPDRGEIRIGGALIASAGRCQPAERRGIGYVAQEGALFPHLSVAGNIAFGLRRSERRRHHRVAELLRLVGLPEDYAGRPPQALSGGEQQRVALARALAPAPKLLLLDEPFSALDAALRVETRAAVAAAIAAAGATAILVTHDQEEALSMGEEVGVLQNGILAQMGGPRALYHLPASPALANFVGEAVFLSGRADGGRARCALGELPLANDAAAGSVSVMIRPEQIKLAIPPGPGSVPARVDRVTFYGHDAVLHLQLAGQAGSHAGASHPEIGITARIFSQSVPAAGAQVWLRVEGEVVAYAGAVPA